MQMFVLSACKSDPPVYPQLSQSLGGGGDAELKEVLVFSASAGAALSSPTSPPTAQVAVFHPCLFTVSHPALLLEEISNTSRYPD